MSEEATSEQEEVRLPDKEQGPIRVEEIPLDEIQELENSRTQLGSVDDLAENIRVRGLLHPVGVRPAQRKDHDRKYELVVGYRRLAAFRKLERTTVPAIIHQADDQELLADLISENLQREDHTPLDEALVMQRMKETFGWSHAQIAAHLSVDKSQVTKRLGLLKLPEKVQTMVGEGQLSASHAEVIARLDRPESQEELAELALKTEAPVSKLNGYASKIKERDDERIDEDDPEAQSADSAQDLDVLTVDDVVSMPRLTVKEHLDAEDLARANLLILLRNGFDREMTDFLRVKHGVDFDRLWDWVEQLDAEQIEQMTDVMIRRWLGAAHRYPTFPESLRQRFGAGVSDLLDGDEVQLPEGVEGIKDEWDDDWDEDWDEDDWSDDDGL